MFSVCDPLWDSNNRLIVVNSPYANSNYRCMTHIANPYDVNDDITRYVRSDSLECLGGTLVLGIILYSWTWFENWEKYTKECLRVAASHSHFVVFEDTRS